MPAKIKDVLQTTFRVAEGIGAATFLTELLLVFTQPEIREVVLHSPTLVLIGLLGALSGVALFDDISTSLSRRNPQTRLNIGGDADDGPGSE